MSRAGKCFAVGKLRATGMRTETVSSRQAAIASICDPGVNLALCRDALPATNSSFLFDQGSFSSPVVDDIPTLVGLELGSQAVDFLGSEAKWLADDVRSLCKLFELIPAPTIEAQLVGYDPKEQGLGPSRLATIFHVDCSPGGWTNRPSG